ncbi:MAG: hypothetical protein M3N19_09760, partial [Candidatus Eremiobacteraeota bacterium]|nr:hypothetical protein [Candidatus Eremiobacteraeota bacterium]
MSRSLISRGTALLAGLIFMMSSLPATATGEDAAALMAKHKAFVGYQFGDGAINSIVLDGTVTDTKTGAISSDVRLFKRGIAERSIVNNKDEHSTYNSGFTGRLYWEINNRNGFIIPEVGDQQRAEIAYDLLVNEATPLMHAADKGTKTIDGTAYSVVELTSPASQTIDVFVDPQTGAYKRAVIDPDGANEDTINILAYADASPGKK